MASTHSFRDPDEFNLLWHVSGSVPRFGQARQKSRYSSLRRRFGTSISKSWIGLDARLKLGDVHGRLAALAVDHNPLLQCGIFRIVDQHKMPRDETVLGLERHPEHTGFSSTLKILASLRSRPAWPA